MSQISTHATHTTPGGAVVATEIAGYPALHAEPDPATDRRRTVVLLHGAFADHHSFERWVGSLAAAGYDAWAPARRGRAGVPPERAAGLTFDDYVDDTVAVLDALERQGAAGGAPVLIGHSLGGLVAQRLAELGRAAALVLVASAPPEPLTAQDIALPYFGPLMPTIMSGSPFVVPDEACSVLALNHVPAADRPAIHQRLTEESGLVYQALLAGDITIDAARVDVPVFVAGAADDRIVAVDHVERTAQHYGVEARVYPDHGHWIIDEPGTEQVVDDVVAWLASHDL
jgi:pimeloyl-ACP methyl ester carboxylesterase